jgi:integrase
LGGGKRQGSVLPLHELINRFLTAKLAARDLGKIKPRTFIEYNRSLKFLAQAWGRERAVADLVPADFTALYAKLVKKFGQSTIGREITIVRTMFNFAKEARLIDREMEYGSQFKAPTASDIRKARATRQHQQGPRMFSADELRTLIEAAPTQLKAMLLLGANCGYGNTDCARLPLSALNLDEGWADFARPKTGAPRRCPLWPETIAALRAAITERRKPKDPAHSHLVFLTRTGKPWVRFTAIDDKSADGKAEFTSKQDDAIAKATSRLLDANGLKRPGLSFYALRHGFETIAGRCGDQVAVDFLMGHIDASMGGRYREFIDDARLQVAVDAVHAWLFPPPPASTKDKQLKRSETPRSRAFKSVTGRVTAASGEAVFRFGIVG